MTAPKASRHSVAVRRTLYSSGWRLRRSAAADRGMSGRPSTPARSALHQRLEVASALLEVRVLVEARAGRREQDGLAVLRRRARRRDRALEVAAAVQRNGALERLGDAPGVLADEVDGAGAPRHGVPQRLEVLPLPLPAEDEMDGDVEAGQRDERRVDVRGLGVVDVEDA